MRRASEGLVILFLGAFSVWGALLVPPPPEGETWAGVLPMGAALALTLTGALLAWSGFKHKTAGNGEASASPASGRSFKTVLGLIIIALLYQQAIGLLGYEVSTAIAGPVVLLLFGVRNKAGILLSIILFPLAFHLVFFTLLGVFPPIGSYWDLMEFIRG